MSASFGSVDTERLARGERVRRFGAVEHAARRKVRQLEIAACLADLRVPPGNRLEKLKATRRGQYSMRINDQYRICFTWSRGIARDVEIVDYQ